MCTTSASFHDFPTPMHQWRLIDSVLPPSSSDRNRCRPLQAVTNFREKQSHSRGITWLKLSPDPLHCRETFVLPEVRNLGTRRKGDEGSSCQLRKRRSVTNKSRCMPSSGIRAAVQDKHSAWLRVQSLPPKASRRGR